MGRLNVLCLFGGQSTEYEVSCRSFESVVRNIDGEKFNIVKIGISKAGEWNIYGGPSAKIRDLSWADDSGNLYPCAIIPKSKANDKARLCKFTDGGSFEKIDIDVILPIIHGANGEDGTIQGLAQMYGVACAGADINGSVCSYDKNAAKILCAQIDGLKQPEYLALRRYEFCAGRDRENILKLAGEKIKFPMFVKPAKAGSSVGIYKVARPDELERAVLDAFEFDDMVLVESNMNGKEIEVAVLGNGDDLTVSCPGEIKPNADFYDYDTKYINDTAELCIPADLSAETSEKIRGFAKQIYMRVGAGGFARVDFFVDVDIDAAGGRGDEIYFNEINTIPGFTEISMFAKLLIYSEDMSYKELMTRIIELAVTRNK